MYTSIGLTRTALVMLLMPIVFSASACGAPSRSSPSPTPVRRSDFISAEEVRAGQWPNAYEMIRNLRPNWLLSRGPDTIHGQQVELQVHVDDQRWGGVNALRQLSTTGIVSVQYFDPTTAAARWGLGYSHGAVSITTRTARPDTSSRNLIG